jgi:hypothetical protein
LFFLFVDDDNIEEEIFLILVMELFKDITEHFVRIAFVDALKAFNEYGNVQLYSCAEQHHSTE